MVMELKLDGPRSELGHRPHYDAISWTMVGLLLQLLSKSTFTFLHMTLNDSPPPSTRVYPACHQPRSSPADGITRRRRTPTSGLQSASRPAVCPDGADGVP